VSEDQHLTVEHVRGTVSVVAVSGEIDYHSSPALRSDLLALIEEGHSDLIMDMSAVEFCDSSGLSALISLWHRARAAGGSLTLTSIPAAVDRLLSLTGLDQVLPASPTTQDALADHPALRKADGPAGT